ncbi:unnamed protein product [Rangifer tarandus platyrhynchus]|uniref:Uncharacterized protein n=1 Tax=Rangifer tarandus platyrhynchus TaxID=3082113 RepID=A0ABN8Y8K2_RANTA|nr:unnamed protein product [Rangifer tarandus platyrhynchus]
MVMLWIAVSPGPPADVPGLERYGVPPQPPTVPFRGLRIPEARISGNPQFLVSKPPPDWEPNASVLSLHLRFGPAGAEPGDWGAFQRRTPIFIFSLFSKTATLRVWC